MGHVSQPAHVHRVAFLHQIYIGSALETITITISQQE